MDYTTMMQNVPHHMAAAAYHPMVQHPNPMPPQPPRQMFSYPQYTNDPLYLVPHMPHHRHLTDPQGVAMMSKQTEPKPRLAKDEVDLLENEFKKNPKPSSQRKREIAELLKVENPRINNWFQNRRAKAKQLLRRELDTRNSGDESPDSESADLKDGSASDYYSGAGQSQTLQASSAAFPTVETLQDHDQEPSSQQSPQHQEPEAHMPSFSNTPSMPVTSSASSVEEYPSPKSLVFPSGGPHDLSFAPVVHDFLAAPDHSAGHTGGHTDGLEGLDPGHGMESTMDDSHVLHDYDPSAMNAFVPFSTNMCMDGLMAPPSMNFPAELMANVENMPQLSEETVNSLRCDTQALQRSLSSTLQLSSPSISSHSPTSAISTTSADLRFKSPPPPANIATRRNKGAPAMLNPTALRNGPYGPKTGLDLGKRMDAPHTIRRISSANGLLNRIQKPSLTPVPRSPLYFERNKEALMLSLQTAGNAQVSRMAPTSNMSPMATARDELSLLPVQPQSMPQNMPEPHPAAMTVSALPMVSDDEAQYALSTAMSNMEGIPNAAVFFKPEPTLKTPPGTPGLQGGNLMEQQQQIIMDAWSLAPHEEALLTPSLGSFGSDEFSMLTSAPAYINNNSSQPSTPIFGQQYVSSCLPMQMAGGNTIDHADYTFSADAFGLPDTVANDLSADRKNSKQFQFTQNITPDDFFSIEK